MRNKNKLKQFGQKHILMLEAYFFPETVASNQMLLDYCKALADNGYFVTIYCPIPTRGVTKETRKKYRRKKTEVLDSGVLIKRFFLMNEGKNFFLRFLRYLVMNIKQFFYALFHKYDLLLLNSTPPTNGLLGGLLKSIKRKPFIYYLHDVFPDSMVNMGVIKQKSLICKVGRMLEKYTYKKANRIIAVSNGIKANIIQKGVDANKTVVVYNWVDDNRINFVSKSNNSLINEFGIDSTKFIVCYAGNIGAAQGIETLIETAIMLKDDSKIQFVIIGNGVKMQECKDLSAKNNLNNVTFIPMQNQDRLSEVYSLGDVSVVACKPGFGNACMPSKAASIMSASTAILASFDLDSELAKIIVDNNLGVCVEPSNAKALKETILFFANNRELCSKYGNNGRLFLENNMSKSICTKSIVNVIRDCIG